MKRSDCESTEIYLVVIEGGEVMHVQTPNLEMIIKEGEGEYTNNKIIVKTKNVDEGYDEEVPRNIQYECEVEAPNLQTAIDIALFDVGFVHICMSFIFNTYGGELVPKVAFDITPDKDRRRFWQTWKKSTPGLPIVGRSISGDDIMEFMLALNKVPRTYKHNINNALDQYEGALSHWRKGAEVQVTSRLFMAVEALSHAYKKLIMNLLGYTKREELVERLGLGNKCRIEAWIRREVIFYGRQREHRLAKSMSDAFEHGYGRGQRMRDDARSIFIPLADIVRRAILDMLDLDKNTLKILNDQNLRYPMPCTGWIAVCEGYMLGHSEKLNADGESYPRVDCNLVVTGLVADEKEKTKGQMSLKFNFLAEHFSEDVSFKPIATRAGETSGYLVYTDEELEAKEKELDAKKGK